MFRLLNKKGFTLVELMIVVVILGILVAIAVPIYSAVRENAERRTCQSNMRMIVGACAQYFMEHESYDGLVPATGISNLAEATLPQEFTDKFDDTHGIPKCPTGGIYQLTRGDAVTTINLVCLASADGNGGGHGEYRS